MVEPSDMDITLTPQRAAPSSLPSMALSMRAARLARSAELSAERVLSDTVLSDTTDRFGASLSFALAATIGLSKNSPGSRTTMKSKPLRNGDRVAIKLCFMIPPGFLIELADGRKPETSN